MKCQILLLEKNKEIPICCLLNLPKQCKRLTTYQVSIDNKSDIRYNLYPCVNLFNWLISCDQDFEECLCNQAEEIDIF